MPAAGRTVLPAGTALTRRWPPTRQPIWSRSGSASVGLRSNTKPNRGARLGAFRGSGVAEARSGPVGRSTLRLLIDRVTDQAVFDLGNVHIAKVVDQIAPGVGDPADPRDEGHDAADCQPIRIYRPSAD